MKVELGDLRLGISAISEECMVGVMDKKDPRKWKHKTNVHNDFIHAVINCWKDRKQIVSLGNESFEIGVKVLEKKSIKKTAKAPKAAKDQAVCKQK